MVNVIIYLVATIGVGIQIYGAITHNLWWAPNDPMPTVGLIGALIMTLGTAWAAIKGSSSAWIVFIGTLFCWAFYIPALGNLFGSLSQLASEGKISFASVNSYLPVLPALLLALATFTSLTAGPMGKEQQ
jgi:hypothetical protein